MQLKNLKELLLKNIDYLLTNNICSYLRSLTKCQQQQICFQLHYPIHTDKGQHISITHVQPSSHG